MCSYTVYKCAEYANLHVYMGISPGSRGSESTFRKFINKEPVISKGWSFLYKNFYLILLASPSHLFLSGSCLLILFYNNYYLYFLQFPFPILSNCLKVFFYYFIQSLSLPAFHRSNLHTPGYLPHPQTPPLRTMFWANK